MKAKIFRFLGLLGFIVVMGALSGCFAGPYYPSPYHGYVDGPSAYAYPQYFPYPEYYRDMCRYRNMCLHPVIMPTVLRLMDNTAIDGSTTSISNTHSTQMVITIGTNFPRPNGFDAA
jgi:hypothetical protein